MQHIRNIETEESKRDASWNAARTMGDAAPIWRTKPNAWAPSASRSCAAPNIRSAARPGCAGRRQASRSIRYAREIMGITDTDQLYA
jgi:hypothetical protein